MARRVPMNREGHVDLNYTQYIVVGKIKKGNILLKAKQILP